MQTANSLPDAELDNQDLRFFEHINEHEWFDTHVFDAEFDLPASHTRLASGLGVAREIIDEMRPTVNRHDRSAAWGSARLRPFATPARCSEI